MVMLDVAGMKRLAAETMPHIPPQSDADVLASLHMARTQAESLPLRLRAYSHSWLMERGLPSQLPDALKPSAERLYPRVVTGVGISVNFKAPELKPAGDLIRKAMEAAVEDCYADGREDPAYVKPRMIEAGQKERRKLFGRLMTAADGQ